MGGCGVRGIFSACVRRLLLSIIPWGQSFPLHAKFFLKHRTNQDLLNEIGFIFFWLQIELVQNFELARI
jgi:hypothetical protein